MEPAFPTAIPVLKDTILGKQFSLVWFYQIASSNFPFFFGGNSMKF